VSLESFLVSLKRMRDVAEHSLKLGTKGGASFQVGSTMEIVVYEEVGEHLIKLMLIHSACVEFCPKFLEAML